MTKERPILFSAPMVRAILDGSKTQTRRVVKLPVEQDSDFTGGWKIVHKAVTLAVGWYERTLGRADPRDPVVCPYGQPGDRLWVRETFLDLFGTGIEYADAEGKRKRFAYAADCLPGSYSDEARKDYGLKWKPSIHMPRAACRILLEIVSVRVERLQEISEDDARSEGIREVRQWARGGGLPVFAHAEGDGIEDHTDSRDAYHALWNDINGAEAWDANPWVWVVEFKRVAP